MRTFILLALCLTACKKCPDKVPPFTRHPIQGREEVLKSGKILRRPLYQVKVPAGWQRNLIETSLSDTTCPNALFEVEDVTVTLHTFPTESLTQRIPPSLQVERWRSQESRDGHVEEVRHDGFSGLFFETPTTLAWSYQLDPELYQALAFLGRTEEENAYFHQMRSDFTIKATGPAEQIEKHRDEILFFADNLELFQAIPAKL
ncbi:MAG: hypothetical protein H7A36_05470 [Chlamydiales bacterium]|nr:hypothetical protein [Chlamydiales bacterium]